MLVCIPGLQPGSERALKHAGQDKPAHGGMIVNFHPYLILRHALPTTKLGTKREKLV